MNELIHISHSKRMIPQIRMCLSLNLKEIRESLYSNLAHRHIPISLDKSDPGRKSRKKTQERNPTSGKSLTRPKNGKENYGQMPKALTN